MSGFLHITTRAAWEQIATGDECRPASLKTEGFIHLSTPAQVVETANRFFRGQAGLVLLVIDLVRLTAPLRWEPAPDRNGELFPHLYGPLNVAAVVRVVDFAPGPDGRFALPDTALTPFPSPADGRGVPVTKSSFATREADEEPVTGTPLPSAGEGKGVRAAHDEETVSLA